MLFLLFIEHNKGIIVIENFLLAVSYVLGQAFKDLFYFSQRKGIPFNAC